MTPTKSAAIGLTPEQTRKARHALGLAKTERAYRNHYIVYKDDLDWEFLVAQGFADKRPWGDGTFIYRLTRRAATAVLKRGESIAPDVRFAEEKTP